MVSDKEEVFSQVYQEYNEKFVNPRLFCLKEDKCVYVDMEYETNDTYFSPKVATTPVAFGQDLMNVLGTPPRLRTTAAIDANELPQMNISMSNQFDSLVKPASRQPKDHLLRKQKYERRNSYHHPGTTTTTTHPYDNAATPQRNAQLRESRLANERRMSSRLSKGKIASIQQLSEDTPYIGGSMRIRRITHDNPAGGGDRFAGRDNNGEEGDSRLAKKKSMPILNSTSSPKTRMITTPRRKYN